MQDDDLKLPVSDDTTVPAATDAYYGDEQPSDEIDISFLDDDDSK